MVQKPGDKKDIATKEIDKLSVIDKEIDSISDDAMVVNPFDFPPDERVEVDKTFDSGVNTVVWIKFIGAAQQRGNNKNRIVYQIIMAQKDPYNPYRWKARYKDKAFVKKTNDIGLAHDAMRERINNVLIPAAQQIVYDDKVNFVIAKKAGLNPEVPWVLEPKTMVQAPKGGLWLPPGTKE